MTRNFYYINGVRDKRPKELTEEVFQRLVTSPEVKERCEAYQQGDAESKKKLPAVMWLGTPTEGKRLQEQCEPTQLYLIDIDHMSDWTPEKAWEDIRRTMGALDYDFKLRLVHKTPSGKGLRIIAYATENLPTLAEHAEWLRKKLGLDKYGDFDCLKNLDRISFLVPKDYIFFQSEYLFDEIEDFAPIKNLSNDEQQKIQNGTAVAGTSPRGGQEGAFNTSPRGGQEGASWRTVHKDFEWHGHKVAEIADKYLEVFGVPEDGDRHTYYNDLVSNFRHICDNKPDVLANVLPLLDNEAPEAEVYAKRLSQCQSICRKNTANRIPYTFYQFLKNNNFLTPPPTSDSPEGGESGEDMYGEGESSSPSGDKRGAPPAPPVLRELISICPDDFVVPAINALMPILGTLTSYVRGEDKVSGKMLSTSFFSIIYAPPSSGKSFVERYVNYLLRDLMLRDEVNAARDAVFARSQQQKSANDRSEALPKTSIRIMEAKNSEAEFLEKQRNNDGHHMFTYCSEIDQWRKGVRAAGGNKDDMIRIAWDNGLYGQAFKSANTFKGKVQLFWNVLIAGTQDQLTAYFTNATNGLVTRCCFTEIRNQEFQATIPAWKKFSQKDKRVIDNFIKRCDELTYQEPLDYNPADCYAVSDKDFDKEVPWQVTFRPLKYVNIDWINSTIAKFNKEQCDMALLAQDTARDTFRRRVAERGKRLALLCTQLYPKAMTTAEKKKCAKWIAWWMEQDMDGIMTAFADRYKEQMQTIAQQKPKGFKGLFELLGDEFTVNDVIARAKQVGVFSIPRQIVSKWLKAGFVEKVEKNKWKKSKCRNVEM